VVGRASRRKKIRREAKGSCRQTGQVARGNAGTQETLLQVVAGLEAMNERFRRSQERYESACQGWCGGGELVPATEREWPEGSLGGRFYAGMHMEEAQSAPSLLTAQVPDHKVITADPAHWTVAGNALVRAAGTPGLSHVETAAYRKS